MCVCVCVCSYPSPRCLLLHVVVAKLTVANASFVVRLMYSHLMHPRSDRCLLHPRSSHTHTHTHTHTHPHTHTQTTLSRSLTPTLTPTSSPSFSVALDLVTCNSDAISGPCWRSSCSHHHGSFDVVVARNAAEHKLTTRAHGERHDNNQEEYFPLVLRLC